MEARDVARYGFPWRTVVVVQQEWEEGICMSPHPSGIFRQHSFSSSVVSAPPADKQATTGAENSESAAHSTASLPQNLTGISIRAWPFTRE
jgi:hypothetical protein